MSELQQPSLTIYRPVIGIDDSHLIGLRQALIERGEGLFGPQDVDALFRSADRLQAGILRQGELQRLYRHMGIVSTQEQVIDLSGRIRESLGNAARETVPAKLLPAVLHPPVNSCRKTLVVATSEIVMADRGIAKNTVRSFFGLEEVPEEVWFDDDYATGVHLGHSKTARQRDVLTYLNGLLMLDEAPLFKEEVIPEDVELGAVAPPKFNFNLVN